MRVIAGQFKGRRLATVRGDVRPTTDRLRESVFSYLGGAVHGSAWLDLFAGSGAIGLEALSRGAGYVCFNDKQPEARKVVRKNLDLCAVRDGCYALEESDAFVLLRRPPLTRAVDFIYLDPPYAFGRYDKLLHKVVQSAVFSPATTVLLELFRKTRVDFLPTELAWERTIEGGDSHVLILRSPAAGTDRAGNDPSAAGSAPEEPGEQDQRDRHGQAGRQG